MSKVIKRIDWERIEPAFRAGVKSVLQICAEYEKNTGTKVSHTAVQKHFKKLGIERDLSAKVQSKADALVSKATVAARVSVETTLTDALIVNESAQVVAEVRLSHRRDINRAKKLAVILLEELESMTIHHNLFDRLGELLRQKDEKELDKLNELYHKIIAWPQRVDSIKKLADTLKTLISLEREAYSIGDGEGSGLGSDLSDIVCAIDGLSKGLPVKG